MLVRSRIEDHVANPAAAACRAMAPEEVEMATQAVKASGRTVARAAAEAAERFPDRVVVRHRTECGWRELTYGEVAELVDELARTDRAWAGAR